MELLSIFEQKLKTRNQSIETAEENWDKRAETFYQNQVNGSTYYSEAVPRLLEEKGIVQPSFRVLDICAGSGRYAIPLAKKSQSVHALDLSSEMLQFLQRETEKNNLDNIETIKSAWPTEENIGEFDVAFSAMCPAINSVNALQAMSDKARKYGVICQFTSSTDTVIEALKEHQLIDGAMNDPHNNRDHLQSYFNILWELGYEPEISYLHDTFTLNLTLQEALDTYKKRFDEVPLEKLKSVLQSIQQESSDIAVVKYTTLAVMSWKTGKEG